MNIERKYYLETSFLPFYFTSYNYWLFKFYQIAKTVTNVFEICSASIKWSENDSLIETNNCRRFEIYPIPTSVNENYHAVHIYRRYSDPNGNDKIYGREWEEVGKSG